MNVLSMSSEHRSLRYVILCADEKGNRFPQNAAILLPNHMVQNLQISQSCDLLPQEPQFHIYKLPVREKSMHLQTHIKNYNQIQQKATTDDDDHNNNHRLL